MLNTVLLTYLVGLALILFQSAYRMNRSDFEIMAPVGSPESLAAALRAGADSIYFGIENLNMRAHSASTFSIDDLHRISEECRLCGVKSYLTVNTIIYGEDLPLMRQILDAAKKAGISAVIASDVAVMNYCREIGQEVHLSTQLNISNIEALKFYAQFADVVVLARELNMDQVSEIHEAIIREKITGPAGQLIRIEMFAHGALCMAVSGKCYMSLHEYNRSANRGACAQVCRHGYEAYRLDDLDHDIQLEIDNKYIMSPKDLKTIHFMNKMMDAGVEVYKIEGRARGPEYVKTVVECYKQAAEAVETLGMHKDTFLAASQEEQQQRMEKWNELCAGWDEKLSYVFNRGFWNGYYLGQRLGEWSANYGSLAKEHKVYAAKTVGWFSKIGIGDFQCEAEELHKGDKVLIIGPTTGVVEIILDEIQVDYKVVEIIHKGDRFTIPVKEKIRPSDKLYVMRVN